jgi:hypothetical protein
MARLARTVIAGLPHHVTQRGNRREAIFFEDGDQEIYPCASGVGWRENERNGLPQQCFAVHSMPAKRAKRKFWLKGARE